MNALKSRPARIGLATALVVLLVGAVAVVNFAPTANRYTIVGYFKNSNGIYVGDDVVVLGVPVGTVKAIEPQPLNTKITFTVDDSVKVPADAKAVILSPALVTARSIQLVPPYKGGPTMADGAQIPADRTAVPVEFDEFRQQLERLADTLQPTGPGGVSTLGAFVNTAADNLRGQGAGIRETLIELSDAFSALGDNSKSLFGTLRNLAILVNALQNSHDVLRQLNQNLASTTRLVANDPNEVGAAVRDLASVADDVRTFVAENRDTLGTTSEKLAGVSEILTENLEDIKQLLHVAPNAFQNFINIYQPAQGALTGALAFNNMSDPLQFLCGAVQAASRLGAEQSAKLCVQYLAPIVKNRQYNFFPLGLNPFVGATARPNELTYSEDWLRPDYIPPSGGAGNLPAEAGGEPAPGGPLPPAGNVFTRFGEPANPFHGQAPFVPPRPADKIPLNPGDSPVVPAPVATDPGAGLEGIMVPHGGGQ
ncbi:MCE family protein [Mycolicibacterium flavescens]|uniref:MCE family protein n=1 Tax=Mycolicibacterium flavescens TaxID=1776 RepID=UPI000AC44D6A|nr:MCE family protein [Mycolicibacterium flavescens]MCV7282444.1 MCE family protein [Mycolicibacterium flavescens]